MGATQETQPHPVGLPLGAAPVATGEYSLPFGILWKVCACCSAELGAEKCAPKYDGLISHDICMGCFAQALAVVLLVPQVLLSMAFAWKVVAGA